MVNHEKNLHASERAQRVEEPEIPTEFQRPLPRPTINVSKGEFCPENVL